MQLNGMGKNKFLQLSFFNSKFEGTYNILYHQYNFYIFKYLLLNVCFAHVKRRELS
jgi:hypothetical protein